MDLPSNDDCQGMNWPNFVAVGPPRSGTTSLYAQLKKHPQVFLPELKEVNYFSTRTHMTFDHCRRLYRNARGFPAIGDITPVYLWDENTSRNIHSVSPGAKIIVTLRDPVARAFSHYLQFQRTGIEPEPSFEKAIRRYDNKEDKLWEHSHEYVEMGMYCDQVRRYLDVFGTNQVLILLTEDLSRNPRELFLRVATHLGIDPEPLMNENLGTAYNAFRVPKFKRIFQMIQATRAKRVVMEYLPDSIKHWLKESPVLYGAPKKPQMENGARNLLREIYDPEITRLEQLLQRKLPELRQSWA
jgi:hypothetical protein